MNQILEGDCLDVMPTLEANSVDAVITDPPYGLSFMGKDWDRGVPGVAFWEAALRVMKPGAFLLSFGGTRTFHRLTCAIEDAGFEIRDCMMWLYGSGFPKSLDVSKAIDKAAGKYPIRTGAFKRASIQGKPFEESYPEETKRVEITTPATDAARQWSGWGTALKPAWEPIIVARKPLEGTVAQNVQKWGCGAMNVDGARIGTGADRTPGGLNSKKFDTQTGSLNFRVDQPHRPEGGRWPANVILDEEAGAMLDGQSVANGIHGAGKQRNGGQVNHGDNSSLFGINGHESNGMRFGDSGGASRFFYCAKASKRERNAGLEGMPETRSGAYGDYAGDGRGRQTEHQPAANNHPTVKPLSLLSYLSKLVTPPGGLILDPFIGSGSTAVAAIQNGLRFIGIEKEPKYAEIARARVQATDIPLVAA